LELRHLRSFLVAAEELHFTRAAERLGITPPSLTVQIRELERSLSAELFHRTKRSVRLSPAGEAFLPEARAAIAQIERAAGTARRAGRGEIGRVEIGYVASAVYAGILQDRIAAFRRASPGIDITLSERPMASLPELLTTGHLDLAFARLPMPLPPGLSAQIVIEDHFCLAAPADSRWGATPGPVEPADLAEADFIPPEQPAGTLEVARRGGFAPRLAPCPGNLVAVAALVSLGAGVAIIPSSLPRCVRIPGVVYREIAGDTVGSAIAVLYRHQERHPVVRHLIAGMVAPDTEAP
jgi:DNA-binding transcriptional LysR family regulator